MSPNVALYNRRKKEVDIMRKKRGTNWKLMNQKLPVAETSRRCQDGSIRTNNKKGTWEYRQYHMKDEGQMRASLERANVVRPKKGKGSYSRKQKHKGMYF